MSARLPLVALAGAVMLMLGMVALAPAGVVDLAIGVYTPIMGLTALVAGAAVIWRIDPAYTLSAAIFLTPFASHWPRLGIAGPLSPDRLLFVAGAVAVLLRAPPVADRPRLRLAPAHYLLALATAYALVSAIFAGTLLREDGFLKILDAFGIVPFVTFLVAPLAFRTPRQRRVLLATLVGLGAYLGLTVLFQMVGARALVFPKYILDESYGLHPDRGRGPFVDPVASGLALYTCAVACAIAVASWRNASARALAFAIGLLCVVGTFLSLERSVWVGAVTGTAVVMIAVRGLRHLFVPVAVAMAVAVGAALTLIPGLSERASGRVNESSALWDRKNLDRAAISMIEARPLIGFGWSGFVDHSADYFEQAQTYPLTAAGTNRHNTRFGVHNTPLGYAVDLGLVGLSLWLLGVLFGVGGAVASRAPPDLRPWRAGLLAVALATLVVMNATPPSAWVARSLWLLAGVVYAGRYVTAGRGSS
jgi:putative inorganic carbon (HCO3(-)) transporter